MQAQGGQARLPAFKKFNPESRLEFSSLLTGPYPKPNPKFQLRSKGVIQICPKSQSAQRESNQTKPRVEFQSKLTPDPIENLTPIQSKWSYEIMQIIKEKPKIDLVFKPYTQAKRQKIEQKDRSTNTKQNSETLEMKVFTLLNTSTLSGNTCEVKKSILNLLKTAENSFCDLQNELTETDLHIVTGWTREPSFCQLVQQDWN